MWPISGSRNAIFVPTSDIEPDTESATNESGCIAVRKQVTNKHEMSAVLFDLDGTLNDRGRSISRFAEIFAADYASRLGDIGVMALADAIRRADRDGYRRKDESMAELLEILPWRSRPRLDELTAYWRSEFPNVNQPMEGLYTTLDELRSRKLKLGIITNGDARVQNAKIDALGIRPYVGTIVVSEAVGMKKPEPRIFELALRELSATPAETWFVGDHPVNDILGASAVGMNSVWLRGSIAWPDGQEEPMSQIRSINELISVLPALT